VNCAGCDVTHDDIIEKGSTFLVWLTERHFLTTHNLLYTCIEFACVSTYTISSIIELPKSFEAGQTENTKEENMFIYNLDHLK
jgi:hypothetical protein